MSREQKGLLERDLELAAKVQKQLLPQRLPEVPGLQLAAHTRPAQIVGGDYFDFFAYPDGALGLAVADVMGKGLAASMLMSNLQASLRILGPESPDPAALASRLNGLFRYNLRVVRFISLVLLRVEPASRRVTYCNAGHNPVLRLDANGDPAWLGPTGPAIGLTVDGAYQAAEFRAGTGEMLLAYTDGLTEAADSAGREFGTERLAAYARQRRRDPLEALVMGLREEALAFAGGFQDDVTVVGLRFA
jgi:sigma-B regulation protein RsbU (phosphoserine phosphatase)